LNNNPDGLMINAIAEDGVVEGVEIPNKRFCLGVQWHPEFFASDGDAHFNLFTALVDAAKQDS
jgi:putative glutamine amidotransferase